MFKYIIQLVISGFLFSFSTLAAWYEGSAIIENSLEWNHSTPFTGMLGIEIVSGKEIVVLDYFVYAIKFQTFYPMLCLLSLLYIVGLTIVLIGKGNIGLAMKIAFAWGILCLITSTVFYNSTTTGGNVFFYILLMCAILTILIAMFTFIQIKQKEQLIGHK